jgi:hypothetical protein
MLRVLCVLALALGLGLVAPGQATADGPALSDGCANLHQFDANDGVLGSPGVVVIDPRLFNAGEQVRFVGDSGTGGAVRITVGSPGGQRDIDVASGELARIDIPASGAYYFILTPLGGGFVSWHPGCGVPPVAVIASPAGGGTYTLGQHVSTFFGCSPQTNPIATCTDSANTQPPSGSLDTSTAGPHTYTLTATDSRGLRTVRSISYTVVKSSQTISFTSAAPSNAIVFEGPYFVSATATSGLPVSFSVDPSSAGVCSVLPGPGGSGAVSFDAVGTCTINADQAGDDQYLAADRVSQSFVIHKTPTSLSAQKACRCLLGLTPTTFKATLSWTHPMGPGRVTEGLPGQPVAMYVGGKVVCTAVTDSTGLATCKATLGLGAGLTATNYTAVYAGTDRFEAATDTAAIQ